jgi:hypothetical protein
MVRSKFPFTVAVAPKLTPPLVVVVRAVAVPSVTEPLYVWLPVVFIEPPPLTFAFPVPSVMLDNADEDPTVLANAVVAPFATIRPPGPSSVLPKETVLLPEVEVSVAITERVTGPLYVWSPLVLNAPPLIFVVPVPLVKLLSAAAPTAPENVVEPVEVMDSPSTPAVVASTVLENWMAPVPDERDMVAPRVTPDE